MKKIIYALLFVVLVSTASATVTDTSFDELPTAWETDQNLRFSMTSTGSGLDEVLFQSREPGEPGFTDRETKTCTDYSSCGWRISHSETSSRTYEYRFRIQTTSTPDNTRYQQVTYYNNLDYGVDWTDEPPETASRGNEIEMSVTAEDSADRFDTEGELYLQYRDDYGDWETFDSRTCSSTGTSGRCSNSASTELTSSKLEDGSSHFRGLVVFKGDVKAATSTKTTSLPGETGNIDDVDITNNLPDEAEDGSSFEINAEAEGENLQDLYIQERDPVDEGWSDWRSKDCGGGSNCELNRDYSVGGTGEKDFRAYVEATGTSDGSDSQTVRFVESESGSGDAVDDVHINNLPNEVEEGSSFVINVDANGENLQDLYIQERDIGDSGWTDWRSTSCSGDECSLTRSYSVGTTGEKQFRGYAESATDSDASDKERVNFIYRSSERIDDVTLDELPDEYNVENDLEVSGDANGNNLDQIVLKTKKRFESWRSIHTESCSGSSCSFDYDFNPPRTGDLEFKLVAEAGSNTRDSNIEVVDFFEEDNPEVNSVNLDNLPSEKEIDQDMGVDGEARGVELDSLTLQKRDPSSSWEEVEVQSCSGTYCEFDSVYQQSDKEEVDFRLKAEAGGDSRNSNLETVDFVDREVDEEIDRVDDVHINNLPNEAEVGSSFVVDVDANGGNLENIYIQRRNKASGSWNNWRTSSCSGDTCSLRDTYSVTSTGGKDFRGYAETEDDSESSDIETVNFISGTTYSVEDISLDELPNRWSFEETLDISGQAEGSNLDSVALKIKTRGGTWSEVTSQTCSSPTCNFEHTFNPSRTGDLEFKLTATSGGVTSDSNIEVVEFYEIEEFNVDSVSINNLPEEQPVRERFEITGQTRGENLDEITVQKRLEGSNWQNVESKPCSGDYCQISDYYSQLSDGRVDFRIRAESGSLTEYSSTETVEFTSSAVSVTENRIKYVNIDEVRDRQEIGRDVAVSGSMRGSGLDNLEIQKGGRYESWSTVETKECTGNPCTIRRNYSQGKTGDVEFRLKGYAGDITETSGIQVVEYYAVNEEDGGDDAEEKDPFVSSVRLDEIDDEHPVDEDIEVYATASGREIDTISLQEKRRHESWDTFEEDECGSVSSCNIEADYETSISGDVEFRAVAEAGESSRASNIEVVEFYDGDEDTEDDEEGDANLEVEVEDEENNNLEDARVHVENGESITRYTDYRGEVDFDLDSDEYTVTASKPGYETDDDKLDIEDGEDERIEFRLERLEDFDFTVSYNNGNGQSNVCIGDDLSVDVEVINYEGSDQEYTISGTGLGGADNLNVEVDDQDSDDFELVFDDVEDRNNGRFTVEVESDSETKSVERQVNLEDCNGVDARNVPSGISAKIVPREVLSGNVVRIKGDVQGVRSPVDVTASSEGFSRTVSTTDSGGYTVFHTTEKPGIKKFTVSSGGISTERTLEVLPKVSVSVLDAPSMVVQGQDFEVCADVDSDVEPEVILFRDGQRLDSKVSSGRVCFETKAGSEGEKNYWVRAATSGQTGSATKKVEVIEEGEEFDTFPGQVAVKKTEPAQARMTLYNKDPGVKNYQISVDNFRDKWVSMTDKEVIVPQRETREVYFYFSPENAGSFNPVLKAETEGKVFEKDISINSQDTHGSQGKSFLSLLF